MNFDGRCYKANLSNGNGGAGGGGFHDRKSGVIGYGGMRYNQTKSMRNRSFMSNFESEFNRGFRPKYGFNNTMNKANARSGNMAPRRPNGDFKNWNNSLARSFRPDFRMMYRKIAFNTIQATHM
jgi:hypothetical protein